MRKYIIYDSTGTKVAILTTLKDALDFKHIRGNNAWTIKIIEPVKNKKSTERQKAAVHFCEQWLNITFNDDINNFQQVSNFLSEYLEEAKSTYDEIKCEYEAYLWDLMD